MTPQELLQNSHFLGLPLEERRTVMGTYFPEFKGLPSQEQNKVIAQSVMITPDSVPGMPGGQPPGPRAGVPVGQQPGQPKTPIQEHLSPSPGKYTINTPVGPAVYSENEFGSGPVGSAATLFNKTVAGGLGKAAEGVERMAGQGAGAKAGGAKDVAEGVMNAASPALYRDIPELAEQAATLPGKVKRFFRTKPSVAIERALRPTPSNSDFTNRVEETIAQIKKANGGSPIRTNEELIPATQKAIDEGRAALEPYFQRAENAGITIPGDSIIGATHKALSESMLPSEMGKASTIMERAQQDYGRKFSPRELKDRLELLNKRLSGYYDASDAKQLAALGEMPEAVAVAQRDATAEALYHALAPDEAGAGPRLIQSHVGDMIDIKNAATRARNRIIGETSLSGGEAIKKALSTPIRASFGGALRTTIPSAADVSTGQSNVLIKKAFKAVQHEPNAWPQPAAADYPFYENPAPTTAKQLPAGKAPFTQGTVVPDIAGSPKGPGAPETRIERMLPPGRPDMGEGVIQVPPAGASRTKLTGPDQTSFSQIPLSPRTAAAPADTSGGKLIPGKAAVPQGDPSVIPPGQTQRMVDMQTRPAPSGAKADAEWWAKQPPTQPEIHERYKQLFNKAENLSPQKPVQIPSTGPGEEYTRGLDAHHNVAKQVLDPGKDLDSASPQERSVIDQLVNEGYGYAAPPKPFAKGGIITKPTLGLIGEDGPEIRVPLTAAQPTTPEKPGTIQIQLSQLEQGKRKVVMIPRGTNAPKKPKGMKEYQDASGNRYIFNPSQISHRDIDSAATENRLPDILGAKDGGMGAPDKSQLGPGTQAVVGETKDGTETQSTAADPAHLDKAIQQTKKVTPKDGLLDVRPVEEQLAKRKEPTDQDLKSPQPVDKAVDKIRGSINVPLDDQGHKEADELGRSFAAKGGVQKIISSPLLRAKQTDQGITKHNPTARVIITQNLRPWPLGALEGSPTEQALPELKRLALQAPAEIPKGIGKGSTEAGQSFNRFSRRVLSEVRRQLIEHAKTAPQEVWDLSVHKSILNLIHAWAKKGARPTYEIDRNSFFANGTDPASVYHISDDGRTITQVDMKAKGRLPGGLYASRHGSTSFNAPSSAAGPGKSVS